MPRGSTPKRERQYEHIKDSARKRGESPKRAVEIGARTVNKERARTGEAQTASLAPVAAAPQRVADASTRVTARDAFAQAAPTDLKKPEAKPVQKRKVAKRRANPPTMNPPTMLVAQRPQFGLFGLN